MGYDIAAKVVIYLAKDVIVKRILKLESEEVELIEQLPEETTSLRRSDFST